MKTIVEYINESGFRRPRFVTALLSELKRACVDYQIETVGPRDQIWVSEEGITFSWLNGKTVNHAPHTLLTGSRFDNEPAYIAVLDRINKNEKLKGFFDEMIHNHMIEATNGQNSQWGTWKFAVRDMSDVDIIMDALKNNRLL